MALLTVRPLDPKGDWNFFHATQPVAPDDRALILPLEEPSARSLWAELVSSVPRERHPMLLPRDHWTGDMVAWGPDWRQSWPASSPDSVAEFLTARVGWPADAETYFLWMRERAVRVPWGVFLRTWRAFLFSDEGPFLVRLQSPEFVVFPPRGLVGVGHRAEPVASADGGRDAGSS
jgi:hypothetical protein